MHAPLFGWRRRQTIFGVLINQPDKIQVHELNCLKDEGLLNKQEMFCHPDRNMWFSYNIHTLVLLQERQNYNNNSKQGETPQREPIKVISLRYTIKKTTQHLRCLRLGCHIKRVLLIVHGTFVVCSMSQQKCKSVLVYAYQFKQFIR